MSADVASRYIKKVNTKLRQIDETDGFYQSFANAIKAGNNTLYQKHLSETRIFDGTWIDTIEEYINSVDNIVRNPHSFIKSDNDIVPIERAKKVNSESLRHLASHTQFVKEVNKDGTVIPTKVLTVYREEELAIYENRFVKSLIDKLTVFVERRYEVVAKLIGTDYLNKINTTSKFKYEDIEIEYDLNMILKREIRDNILEQKNFELLNRIEELRKNIVNFRRSEFFKILVNCNPVHSPIMKTNIIMKHPDYSKCYKMWLFIDSYDKLDYTIEMYDNEITFTEEYIDALQKLIALSFSTVVSNDNSELGRIKTKAKLFKKEKKTRILDNLRRELANKSDTNVKIENNAFNEYYLQETKKIYDKKIEEQVEDGEPFHMAVQDAYRDSFKISETIFNELMTIPNDIKKDPVASYRHQMRMQQAVDKILEFKEKDLKKMKRQQELLGNRIAREKARMEKELARKREIERLTKLGLSEDEIKERMMTPEERARKRERDRIAREKEKERKLLLEQKQKERERQKQLLAKERERERERLAKEKEKQRDKERLAKEKQRERDRLAKEREQQREKERLAKEREQQREKERLAKEREQQREKERLAREKEKQKEKERLAKEKEKQKEKERLAKEKEKQKTAKPKAKNASGQPSVVKSTAKKTVKKAPKKKTYNTVPKKDVVKPVENINDDVLYLDDDSSLMTDREKELTMKSQGGMLTPAEQAILDRLIAERMKKANKNYERRLEALKQHRKEMLGKNQFGDKGTITIKLDDKK